MLGEVSTVAENKNGNSCSLAAEGKCPGSASCNEPDAASCGASAGPKESGPPTVLEPNDSSEIEHVIAIASGKGGVGKSSVTGMLAVTLARQGHKVGVLDADITGPSIPKIFGLKETPGQVGNYILPVKSKELNIKVMSINLMLENEDDPIIWRGPILGTAIKQFWTDVAWGKLDYLLVDLPPGTGDVPLTVMQMLPVTGLVMVSSPQELATLVVGKAIKMAKIMNVPIIGLIENMSYAECPKCGEKIELFGPSRAEEVSAKTGIPVMTKLPIDPSLAQLCDRGEIEKYENEALQGIPSIFEKRMKELPKSQSSAD
ncbi:MAG: Mrp/NBP35 family ATP-binding protein [Peptococcaceae bacterium]|nr:Mrp/NBP35 family ATP-binding protein [Peptococcaceae bacterium]